VLFAPDITVAGLKAAVAPEGKPDADSVTDSADPEVTALAIVVVAEEPAVTEPEVGEAETEKSLPVVEPVVTVSA